MCTASKIAFLWDLVYSFRARSFLVVVLFFQTILDTTKPVKNASPETAFHTTVFDRS